MELMMENFDFLSKYSKRKLVGNGREGSQCGHHPKKRKNQTQGCGRESARMPYESNIKLSNNV